mmetsp:Transcript_5216/g.7536  ORF Transcript_5216/g.7536 Transcript_5216/m.7536 type:complete len:342 (-) Transcript_5216:210-1235(-)
MEKGNEKDAEQKNSSASKEEMKESVASSASDEKKQLQNELRSVRAEIKRLQALESTYIEKLEDFGIEENILDKIQGSEAETKHNKKQHICFECGGFDSDNHFCERLCKECERTERHSSKSFTDKYKYREHLLSKHSWVTCYHCDEIHPFLVDMEEHCRLKHNCKAYICTYCYKTLEDEWDFDWHFCERRCGHCEKDERHSSAIFSCKHEHNDHLVKSHDWRECKFCCKLFSSVCSLKDHHLHKHDHIELFWCKECDEGFENKCDLDEHYCNRWCEYTGVYSKKLDTSRHRQHGLDDHSWLHSSLNDICNDRHRNKVQRGADDTSWMHYSLDDIWRQVGNDG